MSADYGGKDVTDILASLVIDDQYLQLNTNALDKHFTDTFVGTGKALSFVFQRQENDKVLRGFLTTQNRGRLFVNLLDVDWKTVGWDTGEVMPRPLSAAVHILAILYGDRNVMDEAVFRRMYAAMENKEGFLVGDDSLGATWPGNRKACVVYSRGLDGKVKRNAAKEGTLLNFED